MEHYFSEEPGVKHKKRTITVRLGERECVVHTDAGVFSPDRLDKGTAVLLRHLPTPPNEGKLLDLGCGWGAISLDAALQSPHLDIHAIDINTRALNLTAENARTLKLTNVHPTTPESIDASVRFHEIRSNPPIRIGKTALHALLRTWIPRLLPGGTAFFVVAKQLGAKSLEAWLQRSLPSEYETNLFARENGYHIIRVRYQHTFSSV